ncbi:family 3 glycoside hydrolase [Collybia nuda]|uniref:xylan 1,4-beta-xylosidase n=1 Tax=Collybia nuda TaxID=64659 RepID=A0A9P6CNX6_9AGAR|nr:family 3 glycoside hydrolase [Collybia nuda]
MHRCFFALGFLSVSACAIQVAPNITTPPQNIDTGLNIQRTDVVATTEKDKFLDDLVSKLTVPELVHQLHLMFADNVIGPQSQNELYDFALGDVPDGGVGVIHDWYPTNKSQYNDLQDLNMRKSRLKIPMMQTGECLHGVGSFKQSMFPQAIAIASSFDTDLVYRVGRAIGIEARSIGIHACFSPVLDLAKDPRWGRAQEDYGEDFVLTSHIGVAYASGLSKNGSWSEPDAVVPVMKHFAAHGSPRGGLNTAPFMGRGIRQVLSEMLVPFKAVVQLAGVKGVMMAYSELDEIPCHVNPLLYDVLDEWGYDGFVIGDDTGMRELLTGHLVASNNGDTIQQWFNAGGQIQFYDYPLSKYRNITVDLVNNGTVKEATLRARVRRVLGVKYDLGLFQDSHIPEQIDSKAITKSHIPLTLEAAQRSIVLLENRGSTLPLRRDKQKIALVGPFSDTLNFGDYSGTFGSSPTANASTLRQGIVQHLGESSSGTQLLTSWGANSWSYNGQYPIPAYLLSANGTSGGLRGTYFADTEFKDPVFETQETPNLDWGLYPPNGLPSNNFSVVWEGDLTVPTSGDVNGWIGAAVSANCSARLFVDGKLVAESASTLDGNILGNIPGVSFSTNNGTQPPPGSSPFVFRAGEKHSLRVEFRAFNFFQKLENVNSVNAHIELFWNLVDNSDPVGKAVATVRDADLVILAVGAAWNSDGENGDRGSLGLSPNQTILADALFALGKPIVMVLYGGRPFAIPEYYDKAAAVLQVYFLGQSGGQAIADVLFGTFNPGGRIALSIPSNIGQLPVYYNYKPTAHLASYVDIEPFPKYSFGYGLSYSNFTRRNFRASTTTGGTFFDASDIITFQVEVQNTAGPAGSDVVQVYLLSRVSSITQPEKQLMAFSRVYLQPGEQKTVSMELDVSRYLMTLNRNWKWEVERGEYTFALLEHSGFDADTSVRLALTSRG